jgi:hypothetical protein
MDEEVQLYENMVKRIGKVRANTYDGRSIVEVVHIESIGWGPLGGHDGEKSGSLDADTKAMGRLAWRQKSG